MMERIHVIVRARPLPSEDAKTSPWRISGNSISIPNLSSKFEFDRIFGENCKTQEVYEARTKDIVAAAVCGFNGTVFAYGQTNSGKTHTIRGSTAEPGVIPCAVHDLFELIQEDMDREFLLRMSYMEIYNEEINDLLAPEHRRLQIHESLERGIFVAGLSEEIVSSPEQVLEFMEFGESHRHIGETNMNLYSSRSHTIFRMIIESRNRCEDEDAASSCDAVRVSVLNVVDLAGSERAAKTGAEGVRLKEGSHINKSLMTLGTVIKKLSEGAESQGGHVPYRDSKLTRILQPALGGNANTAIICNITLAQIHADETKSSLQFASRALRVTNCAHVNEILTDAALLKRQKKEIEELKDKLQGSHSEHFEDEILCLRNTLLQTELERERIAMELEEEKKAQAEREKRLQEQAKRIENLSSMVLYSNRDDNHDHPKKVKRRDTWCFGNFSRETLGELNSIVHAKASGMKLMRSERDMGPLVPFEDLFNEASMDNSCKPDDECNNGEVKDFEFPDPRALLHVTNRKKAPVRKKSLLEESNELEGFQAEYEDLLLKFETQRTMNEIQIDFLTRKLAEADLYLDEKPSSLNRSAIPGDGMKSLGEAETILVIKQLQNKINVLEMEKGSSQENLDRVVQLATEQNICAMKKYEELYEEFLNAQEEGRIAREELASKESIWATDMGNFDTMIKLLLKEVQEITSEVENTRNLSENVSLVTYELLQNFSFVLNLFTEFNSLACQNSVELRSIISDHGKLHDCMRRTVNELENEKFLLNNQSVIFQNQIEELSLNAQNSAIALTDLSKEHDLENAELLSHIQSLETQISYLSSSALSRENENFRKDLEKTKTKLRETDFKFKNAIQEKTKLEGEKVCAERELKKLHGQKAHLERDISKRVSLVGKRHDPAVDRSSNVFDPKRAKGLPFSFDQTSQEDYKKLEADAFEMETAIASLEEELSVAQEEKDWAVSRAESLTLDLQVLSDRLSMSDSELSMLQGEVTDLRLRLEESESYTHEIEGSIQKLVEEKEELAMQLTEALLSTEEDKAIWSAKEKDSIEAIDEKSRFYNAEIMLLSKEISKVRNELACCEQECKVLGERLVSSQENVNMEKKFSMEKSLENVRLLEELRVSDDDLNKKSQQAMKANAEVEVLTHQLSKLEAKLHNDGVVNNKEMTKLRMRLRGTQAKLEAFTVRYKEAVEEMDVMDKKFEEAATKLKAQLASYAMETINLKKQLLA